MSQNRGGGYLFPVAEKTDDNSMDYKGKTKIEETEFFLSGWIKPKNDQNMIVIAYNYPEDVLNNKNSDQNNSEQGDSQNKQNRGGGYLFPVNDKPTEKHPDYKGKAKIGEKQEEQEYLLSGWIKPKNGEDMIVVAYTHPDDLPNNKNYNKDYNKNSGQKSNQDSLNDYSDSEQHDKPHDKTDQNNNNEDQEENSNEDIDEVDSDFGDIFDSI